MALSGREILLVLRARDEATRTISRVSSAMKRLDRDAIASSSAAVRQGEDDLTRIRREVIRAGEDYQLATEKARTFYNAGGKGAGRTYRDAMLQARKDHTAQLILLRQQKDAVEDVIRANRRHIQDLHEIRQIRRDEAHQMMGIGAGMMAAGAGMVYFGATASRAWYDVTLAAADYEQQARRTLTQTDKAAISL